MLCYFQLVLTVLHLIVHLMFTPCLARLWLGELEDPPQTREQHPVRSFSQLLARYRSKYTGCATEDTCVICLQTFTCDEYITQLPCKHMYHTQCIDRWLGKGTKTCPMCKREIDLLLN